MAAKSRGLQFARARVRAQFILLLIWEANYSNYLSQEFSSRKTTSLRLNTYDDGSSSESGAHISKRVCVFMIR